MEVKIKQGANLIEATIEMVDGVMVVSPKEEKVDVTKFKDGDVITCGNDGGLSWTFILKGEMEHFHDCCKFAEEYVSLDSNGSFEIGSYSDAIKWVRPATEEEKQKLFDKIKEEGYEWDAEKKELVKLKWKPRVGERFYYSVYQDYSFTVYHHAHITQESLELDKDIERGWFFKTKEECQAFCNRLNDAINSIKP